MLCVLFESIPDKWGIYFQNHVLSKQYMNQEPLQVENSWAVLM
jgi:hypothetical protein